VAAARLREFVLEVARALAEEPERVQVEALAPEGAGGEAPEQLRLLVAPGDVGRLVGRRGRTANALRTLLSAAGSCELEIVAPEGEGGGDEPLE
jgi:predicted RNA-binding protein YlqC (UPF0109 family)